MKTKKKITNKMTVYKKSLNYFNCISLNIDQQQIKMVFNKIINLYFN